LLPIGDCLFTHPKFEFCVGIAARSVMERLNVSDREMTSVVIDALRLRCKNNATTLQRAARHALEARMTYLRDFGAGLMANSIPYGPEKFYSAGIWLNPDAWGYDQKQLAQRRNAAVGTRTNGESNGESHTDRMAGVREFIESNAAAIDATGLLPEIVTKLRDLAPNAVTMQFEDLDWELQDLDDQVCAELVKLAPEEELTALTEKVEAELAPYRGKMQPQQLEQVRTQYIERRLREARGVPRLSLFYMPPAGSQPKPRVGVDLDPWRLVKAELARQLARLPQAQRDKAQVLYSKWVEPVELASVEMDGDAPVWKLRSPHRDKTERVLAKFRRVVAPAIRKVAGAEVQIKIVEKERKP
jgi:hypothetical protein